MTDSPDDRSDPDPYQPFLVQPLADAAPWLLYVPIVGAACLVGTASGYLAETLGFLICAVGGVYISLTLIFLVGLTWEFREAAVLLADLRSGENGVVQDMSGGLTANASHCLAARYLAGLSDLRLRDRQDRAGEVIDGLAVEMHDQCRKARARAEVLPALGLLGTVVGLMVLCAEVGAAAGQEGGDDMAEALRGALGGMGTAFATTFVGTLFGAVILNGLAGSAERAVDRLIGELEAQFSQVEFGPRWGHGIPGRRGR